MSTSKLSTRLDLFLGELGEEFTTAQAHEMAVQLNIGTRTVNRWLPLLVEDGTLFKVRHGVYQKTAELETFVEQQEEVFTESTKTGIDQDINLKEGTGRFEALASFKPRTPEEIVDVLQIDTTQWQLDRYWNKEKKDGQWLVSALVSRKKLSLNDRLAEVIEAFRPVVHPIPSPVFNPNYENRVAGVISTQDLHYGKEGNSGIRERFKTCLQDLVYRTYHSHRIQKLFFVVGGDLLNMDTFAGTTTSGTPVDNGQESTEAYDTAFDDLYWAIGFLKQFCEELVVVFMPGNHDRLSSYHLGHALSKCFRSDESITWDVQYAERKVHVYGQNFFGFEHGDVRSQNPAALYATEFPKEWGATTYRVVFTGHTHTKRTKDIVLVKKSEDEIHGLSVKELPSLSSTDYWHYHNKFTGNKKAGVIELYDAEKAKVSEFWHIAA